MTITIQRAHGGSRVTFSPVAIAEFNRTWPGSRLDSRRSYWFDFDGEGVPRGNNTQWRDEGSAAESIAIGDDARELLMTGDRPAWARFSEIVETTETKEGIST